METNPESEAHAQVCPTGFFAYLGDDEENYECRKDSKDTMSKSTVQTTLVQPDHRSDRNSIVVEVWEQIAQDDP